MKRIFIGGCPRSGTTLLQSILTMNESVHTFPETHFFRLGIGRGLGRFKSIFYRALLYKKVLGRIKLFGTKVQFVEDIILFLDGKTKGLGFQKWVEKTPEHLFYIEEILTIFPKSKFILIRRDARSTIPSVVDMWLRYRGRLSLLSRIKSKMMDFLYGVRGVLNGAGTLRYGIVFRAYRIWEKSEKEIEKYKFNENVFICDYESMVKNTETVVREICDFLKVEFSNDMLRPEKNKNNIISDGEDWKENNRRPIKIGISKKYELMEAGSKMYLDRILQKAM